MKRKGPRNSAVTRRLAINHSLGFIMEREPSDTLARFLSRQENVSEARPAPDDCEGDACASVTVTFDETKQQYLAQNNSSDRWVRVSASRPRLVQTRRFRLEQAARLDASNRTGGEGVDLQSRNFNWSLRSPHFPVAQG
jgi:hypothetical protein